MRTTGAIELVATVGMGGGVVLLNSKACLFTAINIDSLNKINIKLKYGII